MIIENIIKNKNIIFKHILFCWNFCVKLNIEHGFFHEDFYLKRYSFFDSSVFHFFSTTANSSSTSFDILQLIKTINMQFDWYCDIKKKIWRWEIFEELYIYATKFEKFHIFLSKNGQSYLQMNSLSAVLITGRRYITRCFVVRMIENEYWIKAEKIITT